MKSRFWTTAGFCVAGIALGLIIARLQPNSVQAQQAQPPAAETAHQEGL